MIRPRLKNRLGPQQPPDRREGVGEGRPGLRVLPRALQGNRMAPRALGEDQAHEAEEA